MDEPDFRSQVFLLDAEGVHPIAHDVYVALARGQLCLPQRAGRTARLADWHVKFSGGRPVEIASEWYGWALFDSAGRLLPRESVVLSNNHTEAAERHNIDTAALPGDAELRAMRAYVFGEVGLLDGHDPST